MKVKTFRIFGTLVLVGVFLVYLWAMNYSWNQVNLSMAPTELFWMIYAPIYTLGLGAMFMAVGIRVILVEDAKPFYKTDPKDGGQK